MVSYPSLGSLMDFKLMYSSYSKVPADCQSAAAAAAIAREDRTVELRVLPVERQFGHQVVDVL